MSLGLDMYGACRHRHFHISFVYWRGRPAIEVCMSYAKFMSVFKKNFKERGGKYFEKKIFIHLLNLNIILSTSKLSCQTEATSLDTVANVITLIKYNINYSNHKISVLNFEGSIRGL